MTHATHIAKGRDGWEAKSDSDREDEKANELLIAHSRDMLDALYRAKTALTFAAQTSDAMKDDLKAIEAVIALATGNIAQ